MALRIQEGERRGGKRAFWGYIWQGGEYEGLTCNALEWQSSFGGGNIVERDGSISVNNSKVLQALRTAAGWVGSISPPSVLAYTEADTSNVFRSGNAAFMRHWSSAFQSIRDAMNPHTVGVALMPAGPAGRAHTIGGFQLAVSRYSSHPREAAELVRIRPELRCKPGGRCAVAFCQLTRLCTHRLSFGEVCHKLRFLPTLHRQAGSSPILHYRAKIP